MQGHSPCSGPQAMFATDKSQGKGLFAFLICLDSMPCTSQESQKPCVKARIQPVIQENTNDLAVMSIIIALCVEMEAGYGTQPSCPSILK